MNKFVLKKDEFARAKLQKALHFLKSGQFQRALNKADRSLRIFQLPEAFIIKGLAELRTRNISGAKDSLSVGIQQLEPYLEQESCDVTKIQIYTKACIGLGWCLLKQGDVKKCREYHNKASLFLSFAQIEGKEEAKFLQEKLKSRQRMIGIIAKKQQTKHSDKHLDRVLKGMRPSPFNWQPQHSFEQKQPKKEPELKFDSKLVDDDQFQDLKCPISHELLKDPVVAVDGFTYERSVIEEWFAKSLTSPMTSEELRSSFLIPNLTLKKVIQTQLERISKKSQQKSDNDDILDGVKFNDSLKKNIKRKLPEMVHQVQCSVCEVFPIIGIRYKCTVRPNFNLCSSCEEEAHSTYPLIKYRVPEKEKKTERVHSLLERKMPDFNFVINPMPLKREELPRFSFTVISEEPEGDVRASQGQFFTKTYVLKNNGTIPWASSTIISFVDGDDFQFKEMNVGKVAINETKKVQIFFMAPDKQGLFASYLRLKRSAQGEYFGNRIKCSLVVKRERQIILSKFKKKEELKEMQSIFLDQGEVVEEINGSDISSDSRFHNLPIAIQTQALNLWNMGVTQDKNKFLDLVYSHQFNIPQVANDLFAAQT